MKHWYLYLVAVLLILAGAVYLIVRWSFPIPFSDGWGEKGRAGGQQSKAGKTSEAIATPSDVLELRQRHQLRPLTRAEDGAPVQELPKGIFGFSMCSVVSLNAKRSSANKLEIQKHHDGIVYYVGYASDEHIGKYLARQKNFHILVSPLSSEGAPTIFEIPIDFVSKCEERPSKDGSLFDLFIAAIPELQS